MNNRKIVDHFIVALRILFGGIFIFSGIIKMADFATFMDALYEFKMLDNSWLNILTYAIPSFEIIFGSALVLGLYTNIFSQLTTYMVALFTAVIVSKIYEGEKISCGCFGNLSSNAIDEVTVIRNIVLIITGVILSSYYAPLEKQKSSFLEKISKNIFAINLRNVFTLTIFFFMAVQLIIFALQNNGLKSRLDYFTTDQEVLQSGEEIKPFYAYDLQANRSYISFANDESKCTLILLFSTKCEPCKINLPNWKYLISSANKGSLKILGLANDSVNAVQKFAKVQNLNFPVYSFLDQDIKINLKGFITPQTILLSRSGRVIKTWAGILNQIRLKDISENINSVDNQ